MQQIFVSFALCVAVSAPAIANDRASRPPRYDCSVHTHPDQVVRMLENEALTCTGAVEIYFSCQDRWVNNPAMEEAATNRCEAATRPLGAKLAQRYENAREACETRFQSRDMRILWSAVRDCKVRLAQSWAKRYPKK